MKLLAVLQQQIDPRYWAFFAQAYGKEKNFASFDSVVRLSAGYCASEKQLTTVILADGSDLLGHCSIIRSPSSDQAYFGFFESAETEKDFNLLWQRVLEEAKKQKIKNLAGPINGSIWFPYRFVATSDDSPLFNGELPTQTYYHKLFTDHSGGQLVSFSSGARNNFDRIIEATKKSYLQLKALGFTMEIQTKATKATLKQIHELAEAAFWGQSVLYEPLPEKYFLKLYDQDRTSNLFGLFLVKTGQKLLGFGSVFYEGSKTVVFKTLAVHPEFRQHGIGGAIAHQIHLLAREQNLGQIIYALVRDGNNIKFFPQDGVNNIRTYSLFAFKL